MKKNVLKRLKELLDEKPGAVSAETKERIKLLMEKMREYWYIHDIDYGTIHSNIFDALYVKNEGLSYYAIALRFYMYINPLAVLMVPERALAFRSDKKALLC